MGFTKRIGRPLALAILLIVIVSADADDKKPKKGAKAQAAVFIYPDARKLEEDRAGAGIYHGKFTTVDSAAKVADWYRQKVGLLAREGIAFNPGNQPGIRISVLDNSRQPGIKENAVGEKRPASVVVLVRKTNDFIVIAVVNRIDKEKLTHLALTYIDNTRQ